jgi:hypothetical protein
VQQPIQGSFASLQDCGVKQARATARARVSARAGAKCKVKCKGKYRGPSLRSRMTAWNKQRLRRGQQQRQEQQQRLQQQQQQQRQERQQKPRQKQSQDRRRSPSGMTNQKKRMAEWCLAEHGGREAGFSATAGGACLGRNNNSVGNPVNDGSVVIQKRAVVLRTMPTHRERQGRD